MAKWKSTEDGGKPKYTVEYLRFEEGKEKTLLVSDWDFSKSPAGYLFKCYVLKEDGEEVDKIWTVWDYASAQLIKKKLGAKYVSTPKEITVKMLVDEEDDETYFEVIKQKS